MKKYKNISYNLDFESSIIRETLFNRLWYQSPIVMGVITDYKELSLMNIFYRVYLIKISSVNEFY